MVDEVGLLMRHLWLLDKMVEVDDEEELHSIHDVL